MTALVSIVKGSSSDSKVFTTGKNMVCLLIACLNSFNHDMPNFLLLAKLFELKAMLCNDLIAILHHLEITNVFILDDLTVLCCKTDSILIEFNNSILLMLQIWSIDAD